MFERFHQLAEKTATRASRRQFLGRLGRGAMAVAAGLGSLLATGRVAQAARGRHICGELSVLADCRGKPVNSKCVGPSGPGMCKAQQGFQFPDGTYNCNDCHGGKPPKDEKA
jgi:hypothetical protein